jgi:hypothetical protein
VQSGLRSLLTASFSKVFLAVLLSVSSGQDTLLLVYVFDDSRRFIHTFVRSGVLGIICNEYSLLRKNKLEVY